MGNYCVRIMPITDRNGVKIDSNLHLGLLQSTTEEQAKKMYDGLTDPKDIDEYRERLPVDENGEFMIGPVRVEMKLQTVESYLDELDHANGRYENGKVKGYTMEGAKEIVKAFNQSPLNIAYHMASHKTPNGKYHVKALQGKHDPYATVLYSQQNLEKEQDANIELNKKLRALAKTYGISDGFLSEIEERMGINGVMDTLTAKKTVDGLLEVIRVSRDERGEKAVPEEFAHAFIELLGQNHPVVSRLINLLGQEGMVEEVLGTAYDAYEAKYEGDRLLLAKEALGQLVAKHWLKNEPIPVAPYKSLLTRFFDAIKQFFNGKKGLEQDLQKSLEQVNQEVGSFAKDLLANRMADKIDMKNLLKNQTKLFSLEERVEAQKRILTQVVENKTKQVRIAEKRAVHGLVDELQKNYIDELSDNIEDAKFVEGLYTFIKNAIEELKSHQAVYVKMGDGTSGATTTNQMAAMLRTIKNFTASYGSSVKELKQEMVRDSIEGDNQYSTEFKRDLNDLSDLCTYLEVQYKDISLELAIDFFTPIVGDSLTIKMGKFKGQTLSLKELLTHSSQDIGFFDRWMDAMADSSDQMLRLFDHSIRSSKQDATIRTLDYIKELQALQLELESKGIKNTEFMFDRDDKGNITGKPIAELDYTAFHMALDKYKKSLDEKYGANSTKEQWDARQKDMYEWYQVNTEKIGEDTLPDKNMYASNKYNRLSKAEKEYYDVWMRIKKELDSLTPQGSKNNYNMPQLRRDFIERIKGAKSVKGALKTVNENIKDTFVRNEKDVEFGGEDVNDKNNLLDFEGNKVMTLPIYFVGKLENMDDLSLDATSSLAAYAAMAVEYDEMSKIVHLLEISKEIINNRKVDKTENGKPVMQTIQGFGRTFSNKMSKQDSDNNMIAKLNAYIEMQVYGRMKKDEGTFGNSGVDKGMTADFANKMTALNNLAINVLAGASNVQTGNIQMLQEAIAGQHFNLKELGYAYKTYTKDLMGVLGNIGNRVKTDKLSLFNEYFDIRQEGETRARELQMDRKGFSRMMNMNTLLFINGAGEHEMGTTTGLAMSQRVKFKGPNGEEVGLYDAMEVVPFKGNDLKHGGKIVFKQGYSKMDGTEFTVKDRKEFTNRVHYVNKKLQGIYNKQDMNISQQHAIMRMVYLFRKWMPSAWNRRMGKAQYNYELADWEEGYYQTTWNFMAQFTKDLKGFKFALMSEKWSELSKIEKSNLKRAITEISTFAMLTMAVGLIDWPDEDTWFTNFAEYELKRLQTEIGAMTPTWMLPKQFLTIVKSPMASADYLQRLLDIFNVFNYGEVIQSGRYKGMYKGEKYWLESIPINRTMYKNFNPDQALVFLKVQ